MINANMIRTQNLCCGYGSKQVLFDVTLSIPAGQITVIVGPNGCGKSTLLKTLCGILPIQSGKVQIQEQDLTSFSSKMLAQKVSYLAQGRQIPDITVQRMVLHGRFPYLSYPRRYRSQDYQIARQAMIQMGLEALADTPLNQLSGGTRQKAYLAMALAQDTPIILLDEPTTYLDIRHQLHLMEQARFLCSQGKTVVMVLHDLSMAMEVAAHLLVMKQGQLVACGSPEALFESHCLDQVFGVKISRVHTEKGWHYYYETGGAK